MKSDGGLRSLFRKYLPEVHWTTIESRHTESGIPDLNGCDAGVDFWIECKLTKSWYVKVSPFQEAWILRRVRNGGTCYVAVRRKSKIHKCDELWLVHGHAVRQLRKGLRHLPEAAVATGGPFAGGPRHWRWPALRACFVQGRAAHGRGLAGGPLG